MYRGDIRLGDTIDIKFCTVNTSGVPTTLAGTPVISAYPDNSVTEVTAGITLTADFDARTGLNNVRVVATGANGYLTATNYDLVITTGTVGGSSVVGYVVGSFSIEKREANTTRVAGTAQTAGDIVARLPAALVGGRMDASIGAMATAVITAAAHAAGAIDAAAIATGAITAAKFAAGAIDAAAVATDAIGSAELAASAVTKIWDELMVEQAQGIPAAAPAFRTVLAYLYMAFRNAITVTSTSKTFANDAGTVVTKKALSDDGTTYTEAKAASGP